MRGRTVTVAGLLAVALGGCGSQAAVPSGREVFTSACLVCHSLSGHASPRQQGGDLLGAHFRRPVLVQFTAEMPVRHRLTRPELEAVVDYVLAVQARAR